MAIFEGTSEQGGIPAGPVVAVRTDSVSEADRFEWWAEMVGHEVMPVSIRSAHATRFRGWADAVEMPHSQVTAFSFSPMTAHRTNAHIRRRDPEEYFLVLVRGSSIRLEQARSVACLGPGDMALFSTSRPMTCEFSDHGRLSRLTLIRLPRTPGPLTGGQADRLLAEPLPTRTGSGALLGPYLAGLPEAARTCGPAELVRLGTIGVSLAASLLAGLLDAQAALPAEIRKAALLARVNAFIDYNLGDPELRPAAIAAYHHISIRALHLLFASEPQTVGASIRRRRLERCHADLADPGLFHRTIGETAARWGFRNPTDFSRAFRNAYGLSPSEARDRALDTKDACAPRQRLNGPARETAQPPHPSGSSRDANECRRKEL
ncbi:helix-turn-helix domain-containing protein [Streptomyces sp. NPDC057908]|uniref:AraC-like ligand-binding domain-containing protein n=1 Tax=Streptomyces sp. NPDC057908 TaxID=3346276 RepID=UPI0036EE9809